MSRIRLLSDHLANQIAAGEVVERPASVVKELLENSLDARATRISVQVEGSGTRLVRVVDNGEGMEGDDVLLSVERHATSKLDENSRLDSIATLGFRGEALPSIGSVSRLILLSRPVGSETGTRAEVRYGRLHSVHEAGCAQGTIVEVRNLFGNVPARKKFLKSSRTELFHIEEVVRNQSLAHMTVSFSLEVEGRTVLDFPPRETLEERFFDVFRCREYWLWLDSGPSVAEEMRLQGYLEEPQSSTARGGRLRILVNSRPVQDRMVRHAVLEGLQGFVMKGHGLKGVLLLDISSDRIDVNVHPAKQEIRFRRSQDVHRFVVRTVQEAVQRYQDAVRSEVFALPRTTREKEPCPAQEICRSDSRDQTGRPSLSTQGEIPSSANGISSAGRTAEPLPDFKPSPAGYDLQSFSKPSLTGNLTGLILAGQLFDCYLLCEKNDQLIVIDQHAAHERVLYEQLRKNYLQRMVPRQNLVFPVSVELQPVLAEVMESRVAEVAQLGFSVDHFGGETWIIKSVPALVKHLDGAQLLCDTLEGLRSCPPGGKKGGVAAGIEAILSSMACKAAVKAGNRLSPEEILELLEVIKDTEYFSHCPHGRPVIRIFAKREIEQWFNRA